MPEQFSGASIGPRKRDAGYQAINVDDTWKGERDAEGNSEANSKFPDVKTLAD